MNGLLFNFVLPIASYIFQLVLIEDTTPFHVPKPKKTMEECILESKLGLKYSFISYSYPSFSDIMDQISENDPIPFEAHRIFYRATDPSNVYILDDGRVVVTDNNSSAIVFEEESYSIWLYESGALDRAIQMSSKSNLKNSSGDEIDVTVISDFLTDIILSFGEVDSSNTDTGRDVYRTPNGWIVIRDLVSFKNYLLQA